MRFIHTSDWHLGRIFHGVHLTQDQAYVLNQFVDLVRDSRSQAVIIAGDIFDRAVPPPEAVDLLDHVLEQLVLGLKVPVIMIAGNHDSPERLDFGSRLLARSRLFVQGRIDPRPEPIILTDDHGPVAIWTWPYAEAEKVRERLDLPERLDQAAALTAGLDLIKSARPAGVRTVLVTHAFVAGGRPSESERPLSLGGVDQVPLAALTDWNYVALGHLHRPQNLDQGRIRYPGSLLKYSFNEIDHRKSVSLVELAGNGNVTVEGLELRPRRDVRQISGLFADILTGGRDEGSLSDYLQIVLSDREPILDPMERLRQKFPNVLHVERPFLTGGASAGGSDRHPRTQTDTQLFTTFIREVTGEPMNTAEQTVWEEILTSVHQER